jgi:osmoprotectant transport system ATP-binding protein
LASPADEYVARFVGADRTLKRLTLIPVRDLRWGPAPGDDATPAAVMPAVSSTANAREALAAVLASPAREAMVVDGRGRCVGVVTLNTIAAALESPAEATQPPPGDADAGGSPVRGGGAGAEGIRDSQ